jgi:hypothetical protein
MGNTPARLGGGQLGGSKHVCAFFNSADEHYRVLLPFIEEGFRRGEKAFHIVDPSLMDHHCTMLRGAEIPVDSAMQSGQLEVRVWEDAYLQSGRFDQDAMLALIEQVLRSGKSQGFPQTRLVANMEWALEDRPGVHDIVEYESRLNFILPNYEDPVICVYDLAKFGAETVIEILRTHPMVIIGSTLHENPFYVPPGEYLRELKARAS